MKNKDVLAMEKAKIVEKMNQAIKMTIQKHSARRSLSCARRLRTMFWSRPKRCWLSRMQQSWHREVCAS